jgi:hypothetical protein
MSNLLFNKIILSNNIKLYEKNLINNDINFIYQYYISNNIDRNNEIKFVLNRNVNNKFINRIYLLNERIYTNDELGIISKKIIQININSRLKFSDVFSFINFDNIKGYNIIANSDIFF